MDKRNVMILLNVLVIIALIIIYFSSKDVLKYNNRICKNGSYIIQSSAPGGPLGYGRHLDRLQRLSLDSLEGDDGRGGEASNL